jgi:hypothetical protein
LGVAYGGNDIRGKTVRIIGGRRQQRHDHTRIQGLVQVALDFQPVAADFAGMRPPNVQA